MRQPRRAVTALVPFLLVALVACTRSQASALPPITFGSDDPSMPYGITAIDYHFHDAHPSIPLAPTRTVLWTNAGSVKHNVTIPALGFSRDVPPGGQVVIGSIADRLAPGRYELFCRIHLKAFGMKGVIVIASE